ncbi:helix-turn-helix transcriptional regulator [Collinsella stercoris]|uniref:Transcriptional regulator, LuxR family n=1 Tax=Collinsella stercoris DSM 13279 TaxID=445975 RepID=B6GD39_9ACTN|nr:LuxR C-terminal-related transcriptional regulator [Collinsella stercoris]EEA89819.1 transcriptional regulator, LuxR family [Collinsella stercoris DSM 13279]UEA45817.1 LuxR C-terminal-related transcriptional regulator [Collinsella stercoris DSM 13279]UWP11661.1 LuxR C-terminal-related transcriptional regulator [Collinsella stercoris]
MERITDIVLVLVACVLFRVAAGVASTASAVAGLAGDALAVPTVVCLLVAIIAVLTCEWARGKWRVLGPVAYCVVSSFVPEGLFLLSAVVYELLQFAREPLPWRAAPIALLLPAARMVVAPCVSGTELACVGALSALAGLLSWRTSMLLAQRDLRHRTRDEFRAHELFGAGERGASAVATGCVMSEGADAGAGAGSPSGRVGAGAVLAADASTGTDAVSGRVDACPGADAGLAAHSPEGRCRSTFSELTDREYEVVRLVAEGLDNHEISAAAFISEGTVRNRISSVLQKTGYKNRTQLAVAWWQARAR